MHNKAWHVERQGGIGASEMAAIIGLSPWQTPMDVQARKQNPVPDEEGPSALRMWLGLRMEPIIAELTEARFGVKLRRAPKRYWHSSAPMHCELDYKVTGRPEHVECKVANFGEDWGPDGSTLIPRHYVPQVQAQLAVTGNLRAHVAALYHGQELRVYTIERDEGYIADLTDYASEWWQRHIIEGIPVKPLAADIENLRRRHPRDDESELVATPELNGTVEQLRLARQNAKQAELVEGNLMATIMDAMGPASRLIGDGYTVTFRATKDSTKVGWEEVACAYRAVIEAVATDGGAPGLVQNVMSDGFGTTSLDDIVSLYTASKPGSRRFVPTWKDRGEQG